MKGSFHKGGLAFSKSFTVKLLAFSFLFWPGKQHDQTHAKYIVGAKSLWIQCEAEVYI